MFHVLGKIRILGEKFQVSQTADMKNRSDYRFTWKKLIIRFLELSQRILSKPL